MNIAIEKMSTAEKLSSMELLWQDLCQNTEFQSPDWHEDVLANRDIKINLGEQKSIDWGDAKEKILKNIK